MTTLNKVICPEPNAEDSTLTISEGKVIMVDEDKYATVFIDHEEVETEEGIGHVATPLRVEKPVTRGKLINQAEMDAYGLQDAMEVASFGTSLSRKARFNSEDAEVVEHDEFIDHVKQLLDEVGIV